MEKETPPDAAVLLNRYSRQMLLPEIGMAGQLALIASEVNKVQCSIQISLWLIFSPQVLIVGAGGIGSTVALYLAGAGVPISILDFDNVEISNLHRYIFSILNFRSL